jgi:hypothetical protein
MPRQARIDAPGALHHIIVRGIGRKKIFNDDTDRHFFIDRFAISYENNSLKFILDLIWNCLLHFRPHSLKNRLTQAGIGYNMNYSCGLS